MNYLTNTALRHYVSRLVVALAASVIGGGVLALPASAQSSTNPSCPKGYSQLDTVWYDATTGSVKSAKTSTGHPIGQPPSIAKSSWSKQALCFEDATGDVEFFGETVGSHEKTAAVRK